MSGRLSRLIVILLGAVLSVVFIHDVLKAKDLMGSVRIVVIALPLLAALLLSLQHVWVGLIMGGISLTYYLQVFPLDRVPFGFFMVMVLLGMATLRYMISRKLFSPVQSPAGFLLLMACLIILARFAYDRPFSARLGARGGLAEALNYPVAVWLLWILGRLAAEPIRWGLNLRVAGGVLLVQLLVARTLTALRNPQLLGWGLYETAGWFFVAAAWTWYLNGRPRRGNVLYRPMAWILVAGFVVMSILSPYRSRLYFLIGSLLGIAWVHRRFRQVFCLVALLGILGIGLLLGLGLQDRLPVTVVRPISTLLPMDVYFDAQSAGDLPISSELGWLSGFRLKLWAMAWEKILAAPVIGNGFAFSPEQLLDAFASMGEYQVYSGLVLANGFHNSLISLAAVCGLPCAVLFLAGSVLVVKRFVLLARRAPRGELKTCATVLTGFFVPELGQAMMNGAGYDLAVLSMLLALMMGLSRRMHGAEAGDMPGFAGSAGGGGETEAAP